MYLKYDNMHTNGIINAFICINNHVNSCLKCMLSSIIPPFLMVRSKFNRALGAIFLPRWLWFPLYHHTFFLTRDLKNRIEPTPVVAKKGSYISFRFSFGFRFRCHRKISLSVLGGRWGKREEKKGREERSVWRRIEKILARRFFFSSS